MRALRPIIRHPNMQTVLCSIIGRYIRFVRWTGDWTLIGDEKPSALAAAGKPFIMAFWHGRLLMMPFSLPVNWHVDILISDHPDGQLIAKTIRPFNVGTIVGSSSKGGANALRRLARVLHEGGIVGITPDGPRGPRMRASEGVVALARIADVPVFAVSNSASRGRVLGSWDRFLLPFPFTRGVFVWSDPIEIPKSADKGTLENKRLEVENALNDTARQCDELMGRPAVEPAPAAELVPATAEC